MLRPYFVQNKYVPHTNKSRPHWGPTTPPGAGPHSLRTSDISIYKELNTLIMYGTCKYWGDLKASDQAPIASSYAEVKYLIEFCNSFEM
jgi:hypothetical protein